MVAFESTLERDLWETLEFAFTVQNYQEQPVCITYRNNGAGCTYIPDALVHFIPRSTHRPLLIEAKYVDDLSQHWDEYAARFRAARKYARHHRMDFIVYTDTDIRAPYLRNAKLLLPYRHIDVNKSVAFRLIASVRREPHTVATLIEKAAEALDYNEARTIALHLLSTGAITTDLNRQLTSDSLLECSQ